MWLLDLGPEMDAEPHPEPSARQLILFEVAREKLSMFKASLEQLTVPQQRELIDQISGGVYREVGPARSAPFLGIER